MAEDDDSKATVGAEAFDPDGPWCWLSVPPSKGGPVIVVPEKFSRTLDAARRSFDAFSWMEMAELLDRAAQTGDIRRNAAAGLAHTIRSGLKGILPLSWKAASTSETVSLCFPVLVSQQQMGAMYLHAVERKFIIDKRHWKTIQERCGVVEQTVGRWNRWRKENMEQVEAALETVLFEKPHLLQDIERVRDLLLIREAPDTQGAEVSGPDR